MEKLGDVLNSEVISETAIIYDVENKWAIDDGKGPRNEGMGYIDQILQTYGSFWKQGVPVDVINMDASLDKYKLVCVPMPYMLRGSFAERLMKFVENGGVAVVTYFCGMASETDLCYLGETPADGLSDMLGIVFEDIDGLYDYQRNHVLFDGKSGLEGEYETSKLCEIINVKAAEVLGRYKEDFYAGSPAFTVNSYGKGRAYYQATFMNSEFSDKFYSALCKELCIRKCLEADLPHGVTTGMRTSEDGTEYIFIQNFMNETREIILPYPLRDLISENIYSGKTELPAYAAMVCVKA